MANVSREQKRITKERILREASRIFAEQGFAGATVREIAEAAQVSESSIFTYFDSKDDLFVMTVVPQISSISRIVPLTTPWQTLTDLMRIHFEKIESIDRRLLLEFLSVLFRASNNDPDGLPQTMYQHDRRFFQAAKETLVHFEIEEIATAMEIIKSIYVAVFIHFTRRPEMTLEEFLQTASLQFEYSLRGKWTGSTASYAAFLTIPG